MTETTSNQAGERTQAMSAQEALNKVAKLLRLAQSDNPHEAALAASRAQEIIDRHKLNVDGLNIDGSAPVESNEPIADFGFDPLDNQKVAARWRISLACGIAKVNQCKVFLRGPAICLIGRASDVTAVRYLFGWLVREVERLASRDCAGTGRTYWNNYRIGCVETINLRLKQQRAQTITTIREEQKDNSRALMLLENAALAIQKRESEVEEWTATNMKFGAARRSSFRGDSTARNAGRRAGGEVRIGAATGSLSSSRKAIS